VLVGAQLDLLGVIGLSHPGAADPKPPPDRRLKFYELRDKLLRVEP
jgi:hypothetical protein